uniref:Major facilitator superfamily (MFS) profile domain-containing protein n=1 Tax=Clastoptera arizonana TaxID=38151 RepID=A0A1B6EGH0_9HEMI
MLKNIFDPQYVAGLTVAISVIASAGPFGWVAPIMNLILDEESELYETSSELSWMVVMPEIGNLFFSIPAGMLADSWGRKPLILLSGPVFVLTWVVILYLSKSYLILSVMRFLQGISVSIVFTVVPLYMGEISSADQRGAITSMFSNAFFLGYLLEYCVGPYTSYFTFTAFTATVPVLFTLAFMFQPESPYLLLMKGKEREAVEALARLRRDQSEEKLSAELEEIRTSVKEYLENTTSMKDAIETASDRRALLVVLLIGSVRLLSGGFVLTSYSTNLFTISGPSYLSPDVLTIIMGAILFLGGFVNTFIVDRFGRRPLLIASCAGCFFCTCSLSAYFYLTAMSSHYSIYSWVVPSVIMVYSVFMVMGLCPALMTYTSELFTAKTKGAASSISSVNLTVIASLSVKMYQVVVDTYGLYAIFSIFSLFCLLGTVLLYKFAPETKGKTFTEIREGLVLTTKKQNGSSNKNNNCLA